MKIELHRVAKEPEYTIGHLYIDGKYFCDTIEDADRGLSQSMTEAEIIRLKVYGHTAIPTGEYEVSLEYPSSTFRNRSWAKFCDGYLPRIMNVKGFSGVLIHVGNTAEDSLGCVIVGENKAKGKVLNSANTFHKLYDVLKYARDKITLIII